MMLLRAKCKSCPWESRAAKSRVLGKAVLVHEVMTGHKVKVKDVSEGM
ncbi:hypothetical protein SEA_TNGUYEN7_77 [Mycobacterium phage TNguyen7]|nr:hypothetical protein SEA_TNGUYEN7_77 [Mycobacterium phage TNguyen7]